MIIDQCKGRNKKSKGWLKKCSEISEKLHIEGWKKKNVKNDTKLLNWRSVMVMLLAVKGKLGKSFL